VVAGRPTLGSHDPRRTGSDERGVALVEFAIVLPLVCLLLFGIVEFGKGFNDYQSLRQGVREGARAGVVDNYRGYDVTPLPAGHAALSACSSSSHPTEVRKLMCLTEHESGIGSDLRVRVVYTAPVSGDSTDDGAVKVCAQRRFDPVTGFIPGLDSISFKSEIEMRMEKPIPPGITAGTAYSDPAPTGGSWSWC